MLQSMLLYVAVELKATRRRERASICCKAGGGGERPKVQSHKAREESELVVAVRGSALRGCAVLAVP